MRNVVRLTFKIAVNDHRGTHLNQNVASQRISKLRVRRALPVTGSLKTLTV